MGEITMKRLKGTVLLLLAFVMVGVFAVVGPAVAETIGDAVYANNSAEINWGGLSISGALTEYGDYYSWSRAYTTDYWGLPASPETPPYFSDYKDDGSPTSISASSGSVADNNFSSASSSTSASVISTFAKAVASVPGDAFSADGLAQRGQAYLLDSTETFTFSIPYQISQILHAYTDTANAGYAYGYVRAWLQLRLYNSVTREYEQIGKLDTQYEVHNLSYDNFTLNPPLAGTLSLLYAGTAGQYILLEAGVDARSAVQKDVVPIPGAAWLLLSGLLGLVGVKRFGKDS